jgi:1,2-diacylglycerol 3-beta-glucosyltransferase
MMARVSSVLTLFYKLLALLVISVLLVFNLRRIMFALAIFFAPRRAPKSSAALPTVLILVPCRDEAAMLAPLVHALTQLDYPRAQLQIVLIDDGSRDRTRAVMEDCAREHANIHVLALAQNVGKARALNAALAQFAFGEIIYIFDADHRPQPDALKLAVQYFSAAEVAGVSGRTIPSNALASASAYYASVENLVHQMVTMRAKDRLNLAPALLGSNCGYRRAALEECGGFQPDAFLEDSVLTLRLYEAGYGVRFADEALAYHQAPASVAGYVKQHTRWARGFNEVARDHALALARNSRLNLVLRAELFLFALGYLDRLALMGAGALSLVNVRGFRFPRSFFFLTLGIPLAQIVAIFVEQRASRAMWVRLPFVPVFFALDAFNAARAVLDTLFHRARIWTRTERATD